MGVDKKNVRTVIHRDVPSTAESFIQESGRGARDGGIAQSFLLWNYSDYKKFSSFPHNSRERVLLDYAHASSCRRQVLLDALGAEQAACSGCDICNSRAAIELAAQKHTVLKQASAFPAAFLINLRKQHRETFIPPDYKNARDRNLVLKTLRYYSRYWDKEEALSYLQKKLNLVTLKTNGAFTWQNSDVEEILNQLFEEQKIFVCRWPFKNKIAASSQKN